MFKSVLSRKKPSKQLEKFNLRRNTSNTGKQSAECRKGAVNSQQCGSRFLEINKNFKAVAILKKKLPKSVKFFDQKPHKKTSNFILDCGWFQPQMEFKFGMCLVPKSGRFESDCLRVVNCLIICPNILLNAEQNETLLLVGSTLEEILRVNQAVKTNRSCKCC